MRSVLLFLCVFLAACGTSHSSLDAGPDAPPGADAAPADAFVPLPRADGAVCSAEGEQCTTRDECCNTRHSCRAGACFY